VGFDACETTLDRSVCAHVVAEQALLVIPDLTQDERTRSNPLVTGPPHIRFYAGAPLMAPAGQILGALCVIDDKPRPGGLTEVQRNALGILARQVMSQLELRRLNETGARALLDALGASDLREQFIAVLGHDLRNPLASVSSGVRLLQRNPSKEKADQIAAMMHASVLRMSGLIENILDFARGRLGGGIGLQRGPTDLELAIRQVVDELRSAHPDRRIEERYALPPLVDCDGLRMSQMVSNLVGNACTHSDEGTTIVVSASVLGVDLEIFVANGGAPIPKSKLMTLFKPFSRERGSAPVQGLGLGLYIASEIATSHGGLLTVDSSASETRFTFKMPLAMA
jgi:signal transduction histidine kinase